MMGDKGNTPCQFSNLLNNQDVNVVPGINASAEQQDQSKRKIATREKPGDDSFENEHRLVNKENPYFKNSGSRQDTIEPTPHPTSNAASRPTFPPFRISFVGENTPSELSIIKDINKSCRISLSYGRFSTMGQRKSFLLFANSSDQFDRLMDKRIWPIQICSLDYAIDFPSKVPSSYSIVVMGIPALWDLKEFESDIKKQYSTIIKVERLFIKGGVPISKVRVDFSSNHEVHSIIKMKKLLLDDNNTSFAAQPYSPPVRILRCYNCQQYNDHVASNCPHKNNPTCFRCGQHHAFNPQCANKIQCANCQQEHMAGNPNCPTKIEERRKYINNTPSSILNKPNQEKVASVWKMNEDKHDKLLHVPGSSETVQEQTYTSVIVDVSKKLDLIMNKLELLSSEQVKINLRMDKVNHLISSCHNEIESNKDFIINKLCPYVLELTEAFLGRNKQVEKDKIRPLLTQFKLDVKDVTESMDTYSRSNTSASNESVSRNV